MRYGATNTPQTMKADLPGIEAFSGAAVRECLDRGDLYKALAILHGHREPGCGLTRVLCYNNLGNPERALAECVETLAYSRDRIERTCVRIVRALWLDGDEIAAREALADGVRLGHAIQDAQMLVYCSSEALRLHTATSSGPPSEKAVREALALAKAEGLKRRPWWANPAEVQWAAALTNLALAYAAAGDLERERSVGLEALDIALSARVPHAGRLAVIGSNLAFFVRHFPDRKVCARIEALLRKVPAAAPELRVLSMHRDVRVNEMAFGESTLNSPLGSAPKGTIHERALYLADALIFGASRNDSEYRAAVAELKDVATRKDWLQNELGNEPTFILAAALAPHDVTLAEGLRFVEYGSSLLDRELAASDGLHRAPNRDFYNGLAAKSHGDRATAGEYLGAALAHSRRWNLLPTAAIVGIERFVVSRDSSDLDDARTMLERHPHSWMSRRLRAALGRVSADTGDEFPYMRHGC